MPLLLSCSCTPSSLKREMAIILLLIPALSTACLATVASAGPILPPAPSKMMSPERFAISFTRASEGFRRFSYLDCRSFTDVVSVSVVGIIFFSDDINRHKIDVFDIRRQHKVLVQRHYSPVCLLHRFLADQEVYDAVI